MGTSQSNPGPGGASPLVPPWADDKPEQPLPPPDPNRFREFRRSLGEFVRSGSRSDLHSALGSYARTATGGSSVATRRMGGATKAGASLYGVLSSGTAGVSDSAIDLSSLAGLPCDAAIDAITKALSTTDGDSDRIRVAMNHALVEALDGVTIFDPKLINPDIVIETMINYLAEIIFLQVTTDAGSAWSKAETPLHVIEAEHSLRELIEASVDKEMASRISNGERRLTTREMNNIQKEVIQSIWSDWERYR
jgi:hypothetical protein